MLSCASKRAVFSMFGGSDPVLLEALGIRSDQWRGINDPGVVQTAKVSDDSRIKRLAQHVLAAVPGHTVGGAA
jgi:hypothetical protein